MTGVRGNDIPSGRVRVLFLAWGDSIHARRSIRSFVDDDGFEVTVVSTHDYGFPNAVNVPLSGDAEKREIAERLRMLERSCGGAAGRPARILRKAGRALRAGRLLARLGVRDIGVLRTVLNSLSLLWEMEVGIRDFGILAATVRDFRPDVVFLQTLLYPCYLACYLPPRSPIVIAFWNGDLTWWAQWRGAERLLKRQIVVSGVRQARAVIVNSKTAADACRDYGAPPGKVHLVRYPGVDLRRFRPMPREEARRRIGAGAGATVLCPRGLGGYLNSDVIVEAAARVARERPDVRFLFLTGAGKGDELESHRRKVRELGIEGAVRWGGQVPWEEMPAYYGASDVVVSVSSNDSLPTCMLEAMACGVPLVMGDIPAVRDWVADGENGYLVPPRDPQALADGILRVLDDPDGKVPSFRERNLARVRSEADGEENAARIKDLVRRVAGGAGR